MKNVDLLNAAAEGSFMEPQIEHGLFLLYEGDEESFWTPAEFEHGSYLVHYTLVERRTGWFCRLSAPGYIDQTDWEGPFKRESAAARHLLDTYFDDF
jgi:hypothetical protein